MHITRASLLVAIVAAACGPSPTVETLSARPRIPPVAMAEQVSWSELPDGWSELPAPPLAARPAAKIWTGSQLFVWSGYTYGGGTAGNEGALFSPRANRWDAVAPSPLQSRYASAEVWTGREVLIWGGLNGENAAGRRRGVRPVHGHLAVTCRCPVVGSFAHGRGVDRGRDDPVGRYGSKRGSYGRSCLRPGHGYLARRSRPRRSRSTRGWGCGPARR